jgi:hypothetical protein
VAVSADAAVLADLARARRRRRLADVDIFEKLYQAYLSVIAVGVIVLVATGAIGDEHVGAETLRRISADGPAVVGLVAAVVVASGLRSGARGGPLTLEAPFVVHVLLSPVGRDVALRGPGLRQLEQGALAGGGAGALVGLVASHRLPIDSLPLLAWAAVAGTVVAIAALGAAMLVAGWPAPKPVANMVALLLVAASAADVVADTAWSPGSIVGRLALSGVRFDALGLAAIPVALAVAAVGLAVVGGTSIEASRRRAGLVSELRFAVTRQDLRTVVLLQRRLAQDAARRRPWVRIPSGRRAPVLRRGLRGLARLPIARVLRVLALCSIAVGAAVGTWRGTTPLIVLAGVALWAAALDLIEPLAQELDHPDRWAGYPVGYGDLLLRHLVAPSCVLLVVVVLPVAAVVVATDAGIALQSAAGTLPAACAAAVFGAAASVATGPFELTAMQTFVPEAVGTQLIFRFVWPPAVAVIGALPLLAARAAERDGLSPFGASISYLLPLATMLVVVGVWLAQRKPGTV